jgi:transcriptional regulator with XRE-family HTH domain
VRQNGAAIREFRRLQGLVGSDLARRAGILPATLINIEVERRSASAEMITRIAAALGVAAEAITRYPHRAEPARSKGFSLLHVQIIRRYDAGESIRALAASIGTSQASIRSRLAAAGVQIRSAAPQPSQTRAPRASDRREQQR